MENSFQIFRTFPTKEAAIVLQNLLSGFNIKSETGNNIPSADITFVNDTFNHQYEVRIKQADFDQAEKILLKDVDIESIDPSHYLFQFTDEELYDILLKPDEWSALDYKLTQQLLSERGITINEELLTTLKNKRLEALSRPDKNQQSWIIAGYIFAIVGGILGLIIGYLLKSSKKTLPNGKRLFTYSASDRKHGQYILVISIIFTPIYFYLQFLKGL